MLKKTCNTCGAEKNVSLFYKQKGGLYDRTAECKVCRRHRSKVYRAANEDQVNEQGRSYYEINQERKKERNRLYRLAHPNYMREYRAKIKSAESV